MKLCTDLAAVAETSAGPFKLDGDSERRFDTPTIIFAAFIRGSIFMLLCITIPYLLKNMAQYHVCQLRRPTTADHEYDDDHDIEADTGEPSSNVTLPISEL